MWLSFPPRLKFAVFTWYGATIEMDGPTETDYTADEVLFLLGAFFFFAFFLLF
uniref:Uncharacterized protein MANES_17G021000 n=1 Tax=Rhizophora mucronata TaxID=61149 RepID=A0A2P2JC33_RHIMU